MRLPAWYSRERYPKVKVHACNVHVSTHSLVGLVSVDIANRSTVLLLWGYSAAESMHMMQFWPIIQLSTYQLLQCQHQSTIMKVVNVDSRAAVNVCMAKGCYLVQLAATWQPTRDQYCT